MKAHEFSLFRRILKEGSGLNLSEDKQDLVEGKLRPLIRELEFPSISHLALALTKPDSHHLRARVTQAVTVQESYFFRDKIPFQYLVDVMLPKLMPRCLGQRRIRIWCAAAATGQEPYSLAMALAEKDRQWPGWSIDIVATDFAEDALSRARRGLYSQFEVQRGLPVTLLVKHFQKVGTGWEISPEMRAKVEFRAHNLLDNCRDLGMFDVIFCRNVLIYFDDATRTAVLARLSAQLARDGYLVLGAAETAMGASHDFLPVPEQHHGIFCLTPDAAKRARARQAPIDGGMANANTSSSDAGAQLGSSAAPGPVRTIKLDTRTADQLEALALERGVSVAELLADFVACEDATQPGLKTKQARAS